MTHPPCLSGCSILGQSWRICTIHVRARCTLWLVQCLFEQPQRALTDYGVQQRSASLSSPQGLAASQARYEARDKFALIRECLESSKHVQRLMDVDAEDAIALVDVLDDVSVVLRSFAAC